MNRSGILTLEQFASVEGITVDKARGWRDRGYLATVKCGKHVLIDKDLTDLRRRMNAGTLAEFNQLKQFGLEGDQA